ncbi:E3 ubiquitin-protein ligase Siah2-like [Dermacentor albipictus]|uniref:E3 ubiquitin-protein ligase Siah2-like n=1 Tax=Dermacentor albipictus TaxID=60249 RepID=UPI0031FD97A4
MSPWVPEGQDLRWRCKYCTEGCPAKLPFWFKSVHEKVCKFRPCPCVLGAMSCSWNGPLKDLVTHIVRSHSFVPKFQGEQVAVTANDFQRAEDFSWFTLLSCFGQHFLLMLMKRRSPEDEDETYFNAVVLLIGPSVETLNFAYRLEFVAQHCRLTWESKPVSVHGIADISVTSGGGFRFIAETVRQFTDGKDLSFNVIISECSSPVTWERHIRRGVAAQDLWASVSG